MRRLLVLVTKNTSTLDYAVPLVRAIRKTHPSATVSIVYDVMARRRILRDFSFYSDSVRQADVREFDLSDTLPAATRAAVRRMFGGSDWDAADRPMFVSARRAIERRMTRAARLSHLLEQLRPDTVLLDHRTREFHGREDLDRFVERAGARVVLLPHAPHHTGTDTFVPYSPDHPLPAFCDYWMPFIADRCWAALPDRREQFFYAGYPGFDAGWLDGVTASSPPRSHGPSRCLLIIRKVLRPGERRPEGHDAFVFDYAELHSYLDAIGRAISRARRPIEVVVKPHPSNDFPLVERLMADSPVEHWSIARDSIYAVLSTIDVAIALYSTTLLATILAGIPTILLHSRIQDEIHKWPPLERLYSGLRYHLRDMSELNDVLPRVLDEARRTRGGARPANPDVEHVRSFFPDGAAPRAMERLGL